MNQRIANVVSARKAGCVGRARFFVQTRAGFVKSLRAYQNTSTRPAWRFHVPRIWKCSINVCEFRVKRKTQNVVDVFVPRLFVVVAFLKSPSKLTAPHEGCQGN
jgi:hypothetical protein